MARHGPRCAGLLRPSRAATVRGRIESRTMSETIQHTHQNGELHMSTDSQGPSHRASLVRMEPPGVPTAQRLLRRGARWLRRPATRQVARMTVNFATVLSLV